MTDHTTKTDDTAALLMVGPLARDLAGWGTDPDLPDRPELRDKPVTLTMVSVADWDLTDWLNVRVGPGHSEERSSELKLVAEYANLYHLHGPWALPPVVYARLADDDLLMLSGEHRMVAAREAGLKRLPATVIL